MCDRQKMEGMAMCVCVCVCVCVCGVGEIFPVQNPYKIAQHKNWEAQDFSGKLQYNVVN